MVAGYQAGVESTQSQFSYGIEATWGTAPATTFQAIRAMSETLADQKTRARPAEINAAGEVLQAVTMTESVTGAINFALSYGTFDDFFAGALGGTWQALQTINGAAGDITITAGTPPTLTSTTGTKFQNLIAGQWIRLLGFTNGVNNGFWRIASKVSNSSLTLAGPQTAITETPTGANAKVRASTLLNGTTLTSFFLQQKYSSALWLNYPGAWITGFSLSGGVGKFLQGSFNFMAKTEASNTADSSTGGILAAPTGRVFDPVGGFIGIYQAETSIAGAVLDSFSINVKWNSAALEYGMGSAIGQGLAMGMLEASGQIKLFFSSFALYSQFKAETGQAMEIIVKDNTGVAYVFTFTNAVLINPQIDAGGPGQPVYAVFNIEGNPTLNGTGTFQIDRLAAS